MRPTTIGDLAGVEVEHILSSTTVDGIVKIRALGTTQAQDYVLLGQVTPDDARQIASHLMEAAARAEYEQDFWRASRAAGIDEETIGLMLHTVRVGERDRHESGGD